MIFGARGMEPIWKMLWSNKALLAVLWEMYPGHPNLLEARLDGPGGMKEFVRKPILSREGANVMLVTERGTFETDGEYGEEGYVWQASAGIREFDGNYPVIRSFRDWSRTGYFVIRGMGRLWM